MQTDPVEESDEAVVRRVLGGDPDAAAVLFDRHLPRLRARVRRRFPEALRARLAESDIIQEAYLAAFVALGEFHDRGDGSFARWLHGILEHKIDYEVRHLVAAKRDARRDVRLATGAEEVMPAPGPSPSGEVRAGQEATALYAVIDRLPEDYRAVIRLVHLEELTLVEAGKRMGRSAEAVRKLYGRALLRLAEGFRGGGTGPA